MRKDATGHINALHSMGYAVCVASVEDMPEWIRLTKAKQRDWFAANRKYIEDAMSQSSNEAIDSLAACDGLPSHQYA